MHRQITWAGLALAVSVLVLLTGCAGTSESGQVGAHQSGYASWYGSENGPHTASGERFNPNRLTAAHRHLPFGTIVRVTNEQNGKSVEVRINDRGPWRGGRVIDLSSAAADELEMKRAGIVPVSLEVLKLGSGQRVDL